MTGMSELAAAILTTTVTQVPTFMLVGRIDTVIPGTSPAVQIQGIYPGQSVVITRSSWSSEFISTYTTAVANNTVASLVGRQVLVVVPAKQPVLLCTIGD